MYYDIFLLQTLCESTVGCVYSLHFKCVYFFPHCRFANKNENKIGNMETVICWSVTRNSVFFFINGNALPDIINVCSVNG